MKDYDYKEDEFARLERSLDKDVLDEQNEDLVYLDKYTINGFDKALTMLENPFLTKMQRLQILSAIYQNGYFNGSLEG